MTFIRSDFLLFAISKLESLTSLQKSLNIFPEETLFLGDDINDMVVRERVRILAATADASNDLKRVSDIILTRKGGEGAVRELAEEILISQKTWDKIKENGWNDRND